MPGVTQLFHLQAVLRLHTQFGTLSCTLILLISSPSTPSVIYLPQDPAEGFALSRSSVKGYIPLPSPKTVSLEHASVLLLQDNTHDFGCFHLQPVLLYNYKISSDSFFFLKCILRGKSYHYYKWETNITCHKRKENKNKTITI